MQLLAEGDFADGYFTVGTRMVQPSAEAGASCPIYRGDPVDDNPLLLENGYWFCLFYEGPDLVAAVTLYETTQEIIELGSVDFQESYPSGADWRQLTVVAQGSTFWFIVDDTLLGSIKHDLGPGSGQVGILSFNFDSEEGGPNAVYDFRDLAVFGLAGDGGS